MTIGIDGNEANQKYRVGSGMYAFELLKQFKKFRIQNSEFRIYLKEEPQSDLPDESDNWEYKIVRPKKLWTQIGLPLALFIEKFTGELPDIFFSPSHYAPRYCPVPTVITIFDLSFIRYPEMFKKKDLLQLKNWTDYSIKQAAHIITISQFSKKEIIEYYKLPPEKITVAYPGYDTNKFRISRLSGIPQTAGNNSELRIKNIKDKYKIDGDYVLYLGTIQPRKNLIRLIDAFHLLKRSESKAKNLRLVIAGMLHEGRGGWMQSELIGKIQNSKFKIQNDILLTGYIDEDDKPFLLSGAKAFVLPSLYEGFGIPVIEAIACGCPVVVSNITSLPEIVKDAGLLVDPYDTEDIKAGIVKACYNNLEREKLIKKGLERVKLFSWESSAKKIIKILTEGLNA